MLHVLGYITTQFGRKKGQVSGCNFAKCRKCVAIAIHHSVKCIPDVFEIYVSSLKFHQMDKICWINSGYMFFWSRLTNYYASLVAEKYQTCDKVSHMVTVHITEWTVKKCYEFWLLQRLVIGNGCLVNLPGFIGFQYFTPNVDSCVCVYTDSKTCPVSQRTYRYLTPHSALFGIDSLCRAEVCHLAKLLPVSHSTLEIKIFTHSLTYWDTFEKSVQRCSCSLQNWGHVLL